MDIPEDDFKGFGDGFDGFPKRLPEDCVEYSLFIIDSKLRAPKEVLARLEAVRKASLKLVDRLLKEYIWQRKCFKLELESGNGRMYLHGLTNYGDSVDDEWLIVYILRELSKQFPELWIKTVDTDGEFLLIEAANALPRWLNPEIADNRVWLHNNKLLIIPLAAATATTKNAATTSISRSLTLDEGLLIITSTAEILINSPFVEEEAFYRLRNYPSQITSSLHHSPIRIPRKLAYILHERPSSIAPAVEAFYLRDPIALKTLDGTSSALEFAPDDLVAVSTRFTKVLYAQVKSQQFTPPRAWTALLTDAEKSPSGAEGASRRQTQLKLGMKVTSGFEMLVKDPKNSDNRIVRELKILLDDLEADQSSALPTDAEISKWKDVAREDDESWMDIDFEDFERELQGKSNDKTKSGIPGAFGPEVPSGFGDAKTHGDLKKMVERFEAFLNDENAGPDGAEMDDMDFDDDEDDGEDSDEDSEDEDKDVSFDEKEFARMMREMMGMPSEEEGQVKKPSTARKQAKPGGEQRIEEVDDSDDEREVDEESEMRKVMERMEAELNEAGVLNLDPTPARLSALKGKKIPKSVEEEDSENESDGEVNIDFNLAKNLLESFKSQAGMAGPGGNILGMMGLQIPRDEDDVVSTSKKS